MEGSSVIEAPASQKINIKMLPVNLTKKISFDVEIKGMRPKIVKEEVELIAQRSLEELGIQTVSELMEKRYNLAGMIKKKIAAKFRFRMAPEIDGLKVRLENIKIP
jgi:hypothetical protein